ncbi:MAG: OmpA family protein [Verrucomicrobiota bacterium]
MVPGVEGVNRMEQIMGLIDVPGAAKLKLDLGAISEEAPMALPWVRLAVDEERMTVTGELPSQSKEAFMTSIGDTRQEMDTGGLRFREAVMQEAWIERVSGLGEATVGTLQKGEVEVRSTAVSASGTFKRSEDRDRFAAALVAFAGVNLEHSMDLKVVQAPIDPILEFFVSSGSAKVVRGQLPKTRVIEDFLEALKEEGVRGLDLIERGESVQSPRWLVRAREWVPQLLAQLDEGELVVDGRDVFVRGEPKEGRFAEVSSLMDGVRGRDGLRFVEESVSQPAPVLPDPVPAELHIAWSAAGEWEVEGRIPGDSLGDQLYTALSEAFPSLELSSLERGAHVEPTRWLASGKRWIPVMAALGHGALTAKGDKLTIVGEALSSSDAEVITTTEAMLEEDGLNVEFSIAIPASPVVSINGEEMAPAPTLEVPVEEPIIEVEEKTAVATLLPRSLTRLNGFGNVRFVFAGSSALLKDEDTNRLERIADSLRESDFEGGITVAGFAAEDSSGYTRWLSQRRADEVWRLLVAYGIEAASMHSAVYFPEPGATESESEQSVLLLVAADSSRTEAQVSMAASQAEEPAVEILEVPEASEPAVPSEEPAAKPSPVGGELLGTIYFGHGTAMVKAPQKEAMLPVAEKLKEFSSETRFVAAGFADPSGDPEFNRWLSGERALSVRGMMAAAGVASKRVETRVYGSSNLKGDSNTEAGQALNRRVEIRTWYVDSPTDEHPVTD